MPTVSSQVSTGTRRSWRGVLLLVGAVFVLAALLVVRQTVGLRRAFHAVVERATRPAPQPEAPLGSGSGATRTKETFSLVERIYDHGLIAPWEDHGWTDHELKGPGPARLKFGGFGGWIMVHAGGLLQDERYGAVVFRMKTPGDWGDFLEMRLEGDGGGFEIVKIDAARRLQLEDGWTEVLVPLRLLNPYGLAFNRIRLRANRNVPDEWVLLDGAGLTGPRKDDTPPKVYPERPAPLKVRCDRPGRPVSPFIYGVSSDSAPEEMRATAHRMGGNRMSRYNWELGAVNTASDYYFRNVANYQTHQQFIERGVARKAWVAMTLPIMGWVAKDTSSYSYSTAVYGKQQSVAPENADMGNGVDLSGKELAGKDPTTTSVPAPPEMMKRWFETKSLKQVDEFILDNEPGLWNSTHRDVHPEPLGYDELLERTIAYGTAVRAAAPKAIISGPAEWGWSGYFWSAKDAAAGFRRSPDRRAHGDVPLLDWYLQKLREHEAKTGVRVLDVVDLHFYPQGRNVYSEAADPDTAALRLRSTRALWDETYVDESWIKEPINLIPRLKAIIAKNYPGRGISFGEWNFGGEGHVSGGLATAEALGRFAEGGVRSAYYWTTPKKDSASYWGFRAFRNFDGAGGHFYDEYLESTAAPDVSLFVSRDPSTGRLVAVALNLSNTSSARANLELEGCSVATTFTTWTWAGRPTGFEKAQGRGAVSALLPPWSITVFDLQPASADAGN